MKTDRMQQQQTFNAAEELLSQRRPTLTDARLRVPFSMMAVGCSYSGKTRFVLDLLRAQAQMLSERFARIIWAGRFADAQLKAALAGLPVQFVVGRVPDTDEIARAQKQIGPGAQLCLVLDDLMDDVVRSPQASGFFTYARHMSTSVIFISHNLFKHGSAARDIVLNANYLVLFRNEQDRRQVACLAQRLHPRDWKRFMDVYADATALPFGYLLLDLRVETHPLLKLRGKIRPRLQLVYTLQPSLAAQYADSELGARASL